MRSTIQSIMFFPIPMSWRQVTGIMVRVLLHVFIRQCIYWGWKKNPFICFSWRADLLATWVNILKVVIYSSYFFTISSVSRKSEYLEIYPALSKLWRHFTYIVFVHKMTAIARRHYPKQGRHYALNIIPVAVFMTHNMDRWMDRQSDSCLSIQIK